MKINQSDLKEVYENYLKDRRVASGESCPSNKDLLSWLRSKLPKREKNKITDHIVNCYDCAQVVKRILDRIRKENGIIYEIKQSIDAIHSERQQEAFVPPRRLSWKIVSFASTLVFLAAIGFFSVSYFSPRPGLRGGVSSDIILVSPVNMSCNANKLKFVWKHLPNVKYYFVDVFDTSLALLWRSSAVFQPVAIPPADLLEKLTSKETYYWMVTSVFEGENKVKSRLIKFKIF